MKRILIIDDDPQLGRSLQRVLQREGYTCYLATDPAVAATIAQAPVLPELRAALGLVPFVFMAGDHHDFARLGEIVEPSDDWLAKPAAPQEFVVRLRTALRRAQGN
jgi:DNA-binding response OmpR family regulator